MRLLYITLITSIIVLSITLLNHAIDEQNEQQMNAAMEYSIRGMRAWGEM